METGTQIILQRMKDCPEEFANDGELYGKWERALMGYKDILPKEDVEALDAAYRQMRIDKFNEVVLKTLTGEEPKQETITYKAKERYATGFNDPRAFANVAVKAEGEAVGYGEQILRQEAIRRKLIEGIGISHQQHTNMAKKASR